MQFKPQTIKSYLKQLYKITCTVLTGSDPG